MKKIVLYISALLLLFSACTPEPLLIEIDEVEPKTVVWSQVIPDDFLIVYLAKSFGALSYSESDTVSEELQQELLDQLLVNSAEVILSHNGVDDTLDQIEQGLFFTFDTDLIVGDTYELRTKDLQSGLTTTSSTQMLETVVLDDEFDYELEFFEDFTNITIDYSFIDPPGDNYYLINFYTEFNDPFESDSLGVGDVSQWDLLTDQSYDTEFIEASHTLEFIESDTIFISLTNISKEYYDFLALRDRGGSLFNLVIGEPINYNSNIENGFGFFNLNTPSIRTLIID